jgi:cytochrome P450
LTNMSYLKVLMKESMQMHVPGALLVPHLSMAECDVEGYTIPSGTRVGPLSLVCLP